MAIKKRQERIETENDYVELIKSSRNPPFEMIVVSKQKIYDYEKLFEKNENRKKNEIKISKAVRIIYFPNGSIDLYYNYDGIPSTIKLTSSIDQDLSEISLATKVGITKEKEKDFKHLLQFCTSNGQSFGNNFLNTTTIKTDIKKIKKVIENKLKEKAQVANKRKLKLDVSGAAKIKSKEVKCKNGSAKGK